MYTAPVMKSSDKLLKYRETWETVCQELELILPEDKDTLFKSFSRLYDELLAYNEKVNLTRLTEPEDYLYRHILDSLTLLPLIPEGASVADVGSGPGFPALPLAMARPDLTVTAIESVGKKCRFMEEVAETLALGDRFRVLNERSETLGQDPRYREQFDVVTARGLAKLPLLLELCVPLAKVDGMVLSMKGTNTYQEELKAAKKAFHVLKAELSGSFFFDHPRFEGFVLLMIDKQEPTPRPYPRNAGLPAKAPL